MSTLARYQQALRIGGVSLVVIAAFSVPIVWVPKQRVAGPATNLPTRITITATEFTFSPTTIQVPAGQNSRVSLHNTGVVEHDPTILGTGFTLLARAGQTATAEFTFDKPGTFDLSVPFRATKTPVCRTS